MANRTVKYARSIHVTNPQYLVEKIIRSRIYDSRYWKEECFALSAELVVDKAMELRFIGGVYGGYIKPTPFLCLTLKMLQIQPGKDIVVEFLKNEEFKYVRALGAFYMRLVGSSVDCYKYLEPLFNDNRKLWRQNREGKFEFVHMDEFIDELLREERVCDIILPRIQKRYILEENNILEPKISALYDMDEGIKFSGEEYEPVVRVKRYSLDERWPKSRIRQPTRIRSPDRSRDKDRDRHYRNKHRERSRSKERKHVRKSPTRHRGDEIQRRDDRRRSPIRFIAEKDRKGNYRDKTRDKYRERRHRSSTRIPRSPTRNRKGK